MSDEEIRKSAQAYYDNVCQNIFTESQLESMLTLLGELGKSILKYYFTIKNAQA